MKLTCPITGSELTYLGVPDKDCRDAAHHYVSSSDNNIHYTRHPFQWNIFGLNPERPVDNIQMWGPNGRMPREEYTEKYKQACALAKELNLKLHGKYVRYFRLEEDNTWTPLVYVTGKFAPADTSKEMLDKLDEEDQLHYERSREAYLRNPDNNFPIAMRVQPTTVASNIVSVQPMASPSGLVFYIDPLEPPYREPEL